MSNLTAAEQFRRRLKGGVNRVYWSASDIHRIAKRFGLVERDISPVLPALPIKLVSQPAGDLSTEIDFTATLSTAAVDRSGDSIAVKGWNLNEFRRNPTVFFNHLSAELPVGRAPSVWISGDRLKGAVKLAPSTANPLAEQVRELIKGGFLSAISVGFVPTKWEFAKDSSRPLGSINFISQTLLEFSVVGLPCNQQALIDRSPVAISTPTGKSSAISNDRIERMRREIERMRARA
jgi:HK97 family phage prohead protease